MNKINIGRRRFRFRRGALTDKACLSLLLIGQLGCAQVGIITTQDQAPIESRADQSSREDKPQTNNVENLQSSRANVEPEKSDVIAITPLGADQVGSAEPLATDKVPPSTTISNDASQQILADARQAFVAGDLATAESVTNRGLRIAPQDPALWLQLAKIRLGQKSFGEAISLSERAQVLAEQNVAVQIDAWQIIASANRALGRPALAEAADKKALSLRGELGSH